ncbi:phosphonate ABC transporter, permease protein PhnE [Halorussus salinisoli]|uniref:phosphonate ABC transporter, permease protein PhnE n=1 Tax=Halorussus salinisoli TaxID=2558242 RepID=UPI0010C1946D|nr:phosphonate ABC transporter, permease protein PhnE [Halorussus salinisoli]
MSSSRIDETLRTLERRRRIRQLFGVGILAVVLVVTYFGLNFIGFDPKELWAQVPQEIEFVKGFVPPNFVDFTVYTSQNEITGLKAIPASFRNFGQPIVESLTTDSSSLVRLSMVTIILGFTGTVIGFPLALFFGVLGSEQVTPFPFNFIFRGIMSGIRAIPALVWILIYVPLAGINEVSAVLAIATDTIGNLGRLFTDELEEIEDGPIEAIQSTGASRPQVIGFGMLSQVSTSYVAWTLYILEINTRIAISLGVVGAGGVGRYIRLRQDLFKYQKAAAGIIMVFVIVISVELLSSRIRARLRPDEHESKSIVDAIKDLADGSKWLGTGSNKP